MEGEEDKDNNVSAVSEKEEKEEIDNEGEANEKKDSDSEEITISDFTRKDVSSEFYMKFNSQHLNYCYLNFNHRKVYQK